VIDGHGSRPSANVQFALSDLHVGPTDLKDAADDAPGGVPLVAPAFSRIHGGRNNRENVRPSELVGVTKVTSRTHRRRSTARRSRQRLRHRLVSTSPVRRVFASIRTDTTANVGPPGRAAPRPPRPWNRERFCICRRPPRQVPGKTAGGTYGRAPGQAGGGNGGADHRSFRRLPEASPVPVARERQRRNQ